MASLVEFIQDWSNTPRCGKQGGTIYLPQLTGRPEGQKSRSRIIPVLSLALRSSSPDLHVACGIEAPRSVSVDSRVTAEVVPLVKRCSTSRNGRCDGLSHVVFVHAASSKTSTQS